MVWFNCFNEIKTNKYNWLQWLASAANSLTSLTTGHLGDSAQDGVDEGEVSTIPGRGVKTQTPSKETWECVRNHLLHNIKHQITNSPDNKKNRC